MPTGLTQQVDLATWEFWWGFNKAPYLELRAAVHSGESGTDAETFFQGPGATRRSRDVYSPSQETVRNRIVPALLRALEKETSNHIVTGALVALARIGEVRREDGSAEIGPVIRRFLADSNQEIAETAALALGILADEGAVPVLASLLADDPEARRAVGRGEVPYRTRAFAAYGLGLIGHRSPDPDVRREIVRALARSAGGTGSSTRDVQVAALLAIGLVPLDPVPEGVESTSSDPASSRQAQVRWVERMLADEHGSKLVRAHAPQVLAKLLPGAPVTMKDGVARRLLQALSAGSKEKDEVRWGCASALGRIGDCDADPIDVGIRAALERASEDRDHQTSHFGLIALAQIAGRRGAGEKPDVGRRAVLDCLLDALTRGRSASRPWAGLAIGVMEHALATSDEEPSMVARQALRQSLAETVSPTNLAAFAIGAGIARDRDATDVLKKKFLATSDPTARGYLAVALGLIGARETVGEIRAVVRGSKFKPELLREAAIALGLLGDKELVPELVTMLEEAKALSSQASIATALGFIGDSRSVEPLVGLLERPEVTASARGLAAAALGLVADKEPLPWSAKLSVDVNYRAATTTLTGEGGTGVLDIL